MATFYSRRWFLTRRWREVLNFQNRACYYGRLRWPSQLTGEWCRKGGQRHIGIGAGEGGRRGERGEERSGEAHGEWWKSGRGMREDCEAKTCLVQ